MLPSIRVPLLDHSEPEGSYLLQRVYHGLKVHALSKLLLPSAKVKKDRGSDGGGLYVPVQCSVPTLGLSPGWVGMVHE